MQEKAKTPPLGAEQFEYFCSKVSTKTKTKVNSVNIYSIAVYCSLYFVVLRLYFIILLINCIYIVDLPV
jgi:hypothetical protein